MTFSNLESDPDSIRSKIDTTRRQMDDTMEALGERLKGRHLLDEVLGLFRPDNQTPKAMQIREKVSRSASTAARSVVDTVKSNPMPALLIGAGIAWMVYAGRKSAGAASSNNFGKMDDNARGLDAQSDEGGDYNQPLDYPAPAAIRELDAEGDDLSADPGNANLDDIDEASLGKVKSSLLEKTDAAKERVKDTLADTGSEVREKARMARDRLRDVGSRVQAQSREVYGKAREQVASTVDSHPLAVGLAVLATGVAVGLALPTPEKLNRVAGPTMDRLKQRTRDAGNEYREKGKRVVNAASTAFSHEAQRQGLTLEGMREKAGAVAGRAKEAAADAAREEGIISEAGGPDTGGESQAAAPKSTGENFGSNTENENVGRGI